MLSAAKTEMLSVLETQCLETKDVSMKRWLLSEVFDALTGLNI